MQIQLNDGIPPYAPMPSAIVAAVASGLKHLALALLLAAMIGAAFLGDHEHPVHQDHRPTGDRMAAMSSSSSSGGGDVTVGLTGVEASPAVGHLAPSIEIALSSSRL